MGTSHPAMLLGLLALSATLSACAALGGPSGLGCKAPTVFDQPTLLDGGQS